MQSFALAGISARSQAALARQNITEPVPVQAQAIPALLEGRDVVVQAPTGSGKTLAFLLPLVERYASSGPGPRALVVTPTRELAIQIESVFRSLDSDLRVALLYGGVGYHTQTTALKGGVDLVVGTPGRILDMIGRKLLSLSRVEYLVLDEADEMLDAGFAPDVEKILAMTYEPQTVLASATMPEWVSRMISRHLNDPVTIRVVDDRPSLLEHGLVRTHRDRKLGLLSEILRRNPGAIVFGRTKHGVKKLNRDLQRLGHNSVELQGNMAQNARDRVMELFRSQRSDVLVATNVAARGLDMSHVGLVVNFELPDTAEALTHRVGRTARMGAAGRALTFLTAEDGQQWAKLRRQGALPLQPVDAEQLAATGEWQFLDGDAEPPVANDGFRGSSSSGRSSFPRRGGGPRRPAGAGTPATPSGQARPTSGAPAGDAPAEDGSAPRRRRRRRGGRGRRPAGTPGSGNPPVAAD